ncbi:MAG TPA: HEAT repeat domain-containing protein [Pyrinomonadaceae bacterium]
MLKRTRRKLLATLTAVLALSALAFAAGAGAQRGGARQANQGAGAGRTKRVFVGRGSETNKGSRVTITADDSLKDYRAYRSGDRFYVELPKSAAGSGLRGSGKGYSDMQVEQRGDSVVLSYRVQPGAKSRVEQRFNRLEVVFDVPEGGGQQQQAAAGNANAARAQQQQPPAPQETRTQPPAAQQTNQTAAPAQPNPNNPADRNTAERNAAEAARAQAQNAATAGTTAPPATALPPAPAAADPNAPAGAAPAPTQEATAAATPAAAEPQLAQAQPPAQVAPITTQNPAANNPGGTTFGTFLIRNWALTLILAAVALTGLGLIISARRKTAGPAPVESLDEARAGVLEEKRAARVKETSAAALREASAAAATAAKVETAKVETAKVETAKATPRPEAVEVTPTLEAAEASGADATTLASAAALAGGAAAANSRKQSRKEARQDAKKKKKKGARVEAAPAVADETTAATPVVEGSAARETALEESATLETLQAAPLTAEALAEAPVTEQPEVEEVAPGEALAETPEVEEAAGVEATAGGTDEQASDETSPAAVESLEGVAEVAAPAWFSAGEMPAEAPVAEMDFDTKELAPVGVEAESVSPHVSEFEAPEAEAVEVAQAEPATSQAIEPAPVEAEEPAADIEPALAPDPESVQAATRLLLEGGAYDRSVISTRDPFARQMIAAELLSALAGRNAPRRERAGAAFVEQGYFDETARDLRGADAPAERAAAARSLALLGDRAATPHLVAALEDTSIDVRRAAVEALGALRDPSAAAPLEALLERERTERNRIPPRVIRVAVEACHEGAHEPAAETARAEESRAIAPVKEPEAEAAPAPVAEFAQAAEPAQAPEPEPFAEVAAEPVSETSVSIAPFVEEREAEAATVEVPLAESVAPEQESRPTFFGGWQTDAEETLVAESETRTLEASVPEVEHFASEPGPTAAAEAPPAETGVLPFTADEPEEFSSAGAQSFESVVSEPQAVVESGIQPFAETGTPAEETPAALAPAADEATREIEPAPAAFVGEPAPAADSPSAGEWVDFDMREFRAEPTPAEPEPAFAQSSAPEAVFETSAGEALSAPPAPDVDESAAAEPSPFLDARADSARVADTFAPVETAQEVARPSSQDEKGLAPFDEHSTVPASIQQRLASGQPSERAAAIVELSHVDTDEAFHQICAAFDDESEAVRDAAARALYELRADRAESFTRALREATPERRRQIGAAIASSGLASESVSQLTGESRERTYEAFSLLFLMAKAGEVQPLVRAIESHPNNEVRLAVVKLLALSGQKEILPAFRRLAVRGSLPTEVRSAVMEAIYQISSSQPTPA